MIKRLNQYVLSKIMSIRLRPTAAVFLGGFAGLSLTTTVLPTAISVLGATDSFSARLDLAGFAVYAFMSWAVGGWAAQRTGSVQAGGVILGLVGLISAAVFGGMAYDIDNDGREEVYLPTYPGVPGGPGAGIVHMISYNTGQPTTQIDSTNVTRLDFASVTVARMTLAPPSFVSSAATSCVVLSM